MNKELTALQFYKQIEKEQDKYKLINGLFIVRYIDKETSVYVGDFLKGGNALNPTTINKVLINENTDPQQFNKIKNICTTSLVFWKTLNIKFIERPIKNIIKNEVEK